MSDIVDIIHRFNYEVQGQQSLSQVQQILQQQVQTIGQNTASLRRLEQALANTTNPQLQQRIQQAIQNRRNAIAAENTAIADMLRNNTQLQGALRAEIGIINELNSRLNQLRQARDRATSVEELARYNRQIQNIERQQGQFAQQGLNGGGSLLGGIGSSIMQGLGIGTGMGIFGALESGVGFIKDFATESFTAAANFDQLKVAFTTMLQSEPKANKLLADIVSFAANTPYGVEQLTDLSKQLLAYGFQAEEIIPTLDMLGNVAAGVGKDKMPQIILAFGQIRAAGKLAGQDLLQLINAGFNPLQVISEKTGESMTSLKAKMEKGAISFQMVKDAFKAATSEGGKFFNLMQNQTNTVAGQMDRFGDSVQQLKVAFGELLQSSGSSVIGFFASLIEKTTELIKLSPADEIRKEQYALNLLVEAINDHNISAETRNGLINQLRQNYPDFLGKLKDEEITTGLLRNRLIDVNREYEKRLNLIGKTQVKEALLQQKQTESNSLAEAAQVRAALRLSGVDKPLDQVTKADIEGLSDQGRVNLKSTLSKLNFFSGFQSVFGANVIASRVYLDAIRRADELEKKAQANSKTTDAAVTNALKEEEEAQKQADPLVMAMENRQKYLDILKRQREIVKTKTGKVKEQYEASIKENENQVKILDDQIKSIQDASKPAPTGGGEEKKKKGPKPKTAEQLADEAYKKSVEQIEVQIGNQKQMDQKLKELRGLQLKNEQAYTSYVNSQEFQTDSREQRAGRQNTYNMLGQVLSSQAQKINLTYDIAEIALKIDSATKLKRQPELIKLVDELGKKQLDYAKIRVELPVDVKIDTKAYADWGLKAQKAFNDALYKAQQEQQEREATILKKRQDAYSDMYSSILSNASTVIDSIYNKQIKSYDAEIAYRQITVQRAADLAMKGNTEVLEQEEESLRQATAARERAAQRQQELNAILQASNMAVALSEAIGAIVKAAAEGDPYTIAARVIAAVAALVGGVTALTSAFSSVNSQGFKDGVIDLQGPGTTKSDSIPARLSRGESVLTAEATAKYRPYLERMNALDFNLADHMPAAVVYLPKPPKNVPQGQDNPSKHDFDMLGKKLDTVAEAVSNLQVKASQKIDRNGVAQSVELYLQQEKRRFS